MARRYPEPAPRFRPLPGRADGCTPAGRAVSQTGRVSLVAVFLAACTPAGSVLWNGVLIGAGAALGTQHELVERWAGVLDRAVVVGVVVVLGLGLGRRLRRRSSRLDG